MRRELVVLAVFMAACAGDDELPASDGQISETALDSGAPLGTLIPGTWIKIEPGTFNMGSPSTEPCREADELQHQVTLTHPFELAETEVTQKQFRSLMLYNPAFDQTCGEACPVEWVTWHEAAAYCDAISRATQHPACHSCTGQGSAVRCEGASPGCKGYRLPTEAEWEYAARAGSETAFPTGGITTCMGTEGSADTVSWYKVNSLGALHPVKTRAPNAWKLYDMNGSVDEWVHDWYQADIGAAAATDPTGPASGTERVLRGGAWYFNAEHARAAARERFRPDKPFNFVGFRCARAL